LEYDPDLPKITDTLDLPGPQFSLGHGGKHHRRENANDGDDTQQFDKRKRQ
jgi:hypothetical protein